MATLLKRGDWYHLAFYDLTRQPARKQVPLRTKSEHEAVRLQVRLEDAYATGSFDPWAATPHTRRASNDRLEAAAEAFIATRSNLSPYTIKKYRSVLGLLVEFLGGEADVHRITTEDVHRFLDNTPKRAITKRTYVTTLSPFFTWLNEGVGVENNPIQALRLERVPNKFPRFLSTADLERIVEAIRREEQLTHVEAGTSLWLLPIVQANVYLGLRAGELVNLRWEHVDLERRVLHVANTETFRTKSQRDRSLPLCQAVMQVLSSLDARTPYVFPSHTGGKLGRQYLSRRFKHFARLAGLSEEINFHATRHTAASWLAQAGCNIEALRLYMGHSSVTVTQKYMHLSQQTFAKEIHDVFDRLR